MLGEDSSERKTFESDFKINRISKGKKMRKTSTDRKNTINTV